MWIDGERLSDEQRQAVEILGEHPLGLGETGFKKAMWPDKAVDVKGVEDVPLGTLEDAFRGVHRITQPLWPYRVRMVAPEETRLDAEIDPA